MFLLLLLILSFSNISKSSIVIVPELTFKSSDKIPSIVFTNVVFPAPLGPVRPIIFPIGILREILFKRLFPFLSLTCN